MLSLFFPPCQINRKVKIQQSCVYVVFLEEEPIEIVLRSLLCASYKLEMSIQSLVSYNYS